jgi:hypothetical protein
MAVLAGVPLLGAAALYLFFALGMQPIENSLLAHYTPERWRASAYGVKFACTFGIGSLGVWLVRWADRAGGLSAAVLCMAGVVLLVIVVAAMLLRLTAGAPGRRVLPAAPAGVRLAVPAGGTSAAPTNR